MWLTFYSTGLSCSELGLSPAVLSPTGVIGGVRKRIQWYFGIEYWLAIVYSMCCIKSPSTMCLKNVCYLLFFNLKQLEEPSSWYLAHSIPKIIPLNCMHNFPPHLSYVATLPENILATEQVRCFPLGGWLWKDHGRQNCKRKISKCEAWCEIINAFRS